MSKRKGKRSLYGGEELVVVTLKMPVSLRDKLAKVAQKDVRSLGAQIVWFVKTGLTKREHESEVG